MKMKTLLTLAMTLALGFTTALAAEDDTPLMKEMKALNKSLRTLKRQVADATKKDENVQLIAGIKKNLDASIKLQPAQTKDIPAAEKTAYLDKYKQQMTELGKMFDELDAAVKAGKTDVATATFEKLSQAKEKGHKDFGADE
jgi:thiamine kinase-like enzyme